MIFIKEITLGDIISICALVATTITLIIMIIQRKESTKPIVFIRSNNQYRQTYTFKNNDIDKDLDIDLCTLGNGIATDINVISHICFASPLGEYKSLKINKGSIRVTRENANIYMFIREVRLHFDAIGLSENNNIGFTLRDFICAAAYIAIDYCQKESMDEEKVFTSELNCPYVIFQITYKDLNYHLYNVFYRMDLNIIMFSQDECRFCLYCNSIKEKEYVKYLEMVEKQNLHNKL